MNSSSLNSDPKNTWHDPRWPESVTDVGYLIYANNGYWCLQDFFGDTMFASTNRSSCFFKAAECGIVILQRH